MASGISDRTSPNSIHDRGTVNPTLGGWLFRHRTSIPVPVALALLLIRIGEAPPSSTLVLAGAVLTLAGEWLRLVAVHHIGVISRTRSTRLGPLVTSGPFAIVRNPLYVGNIAIWTGFALIARLLWMVPLVAALLALEYTAIVRWEEQLLIERYGDEYRAYAARVGRWIPRLTHSAGANVAADGARFSWTETFYSERGTLIAIAAGFLLLWLKP